MKRRTFLTSGVLVAGSAALSGCVDHVLTEAESQPPIFDDRYDEEEQSLPVTRRFDRAIEGIERAEGTTLDDPDAFQEFLEDHELTVDSLEETTEGTESILELDYTDDAIGERGVLFGLGVVSGGYATLVENVDSTDKLDATVHEHTGEPFGTFDIETSWAEALLAGELSIAEYALEVMHTLETTE